MNAVTNALLCDGCGVAEKAVGNWDAAGRWKSLWDLFDGRIVALPVPVQEIRIRECNGRLLCQRCARREGRQ